MMKHMTIAVIISTVLFSVNASGAQIAVPDGATAVENTAARELAAALQRITGIAYEVLPESKERGGSDPNGGV